MSKAIINNSENDLILSNSWEKIHARIEACKIKNFSDQEKANLKRKTKKLEEVKLIERRAFLKSFTKLCKKVFGINKEQLKTFSKGELIEIADVLFKITKNEAAIQKYVFAPLLLFIPIVGWLLIAILRTGTIKWAYRINYSRLKRQYGEDWFPMDVFLNTLW